MSLPNKNKFKYNLPTSKKIKENDVDALVQELLCGNKQLTKEQKQRKRDLEEFLINKLEQFDEESDESAASSDADTEDSESESDSETDSDSQGDSESDSETDSNENSATATDDDSDSNSSDEDGDDDGDSDSSSEFSESDDGHNYKKHSDEFTDEYTINSYSDDDYPN